MLRSRWTALIFVVLVGSVIISGAGDRWPEARPGSGAVPSWSAPVSAQGTAGSPEAEVPVGAARVERRSISRSVTYHGILQPRQFVQLALTQGGRIADVPVDVGDRVVAGDVLLRLETDELEAHLRQAEAGVDGAVARLEQLLAGATAEDLRQARASVRQAQVELDNARQEFERTEQLFRVGAVTRQTYEGAQARLRAAESAVESATAHLDRVQRGALEHDIAAAEAALHQAEAARDLARIQLDRARLTSPIDGVVTSRSAEPGEIASPGVPVVSVANTDQLRVMVWAPGVDVVRLQEGMPVQITVEDVPDLSFQGHIHRIDPVADVQTNLFRVELRMSNPGGSVRAGLYAAARLPIETVADGLAVPEQAVAQHGGQPGVWVIDDGRARFVPLTFGLSDGHWRAIVPPAAVEEGQAVITYGREAVGPGSRVRVHEETR